MKKSRREAVAVDKHEALKHYFGHEDFRPGQEILVDALLSGRDALGVMPTGAGKSLCYQIPALLLPGITLVVSPLISLMADQVAALKAAGVPAAYLNSTLTPRQMDIAIDRASQGWYKIIYVAPERLEAPSFLRFARQAEIALVAVDEAHCVSQWGQDFRPVYLRIADFVTQLSRRPVMGAFTATATQRVKEDIIRHLRLREPTGITTGFDRPNLYFEVVRLQKRDPALLRVLRGKESQSGIVYCATRKNVEKVCDLLNNAGFSASRYHAGLTDEERKRNQEDFQYDRVQIMVATNAFGMGIDKSNVRFVIHYNMPKSMEAYYQEAGRAGRDGEPSECILLFSKQDIVTARYLIQHSEPNADLSAAEQAQVRQLDYQRLQSMIDYCTKDVCLRRSILRYFGENTAADCGDCGHCTGGRYGERTAPAEAGMAPSGTPPRAARTKQPEPEAPMGKIEGAGDLFEKLRAVRTALARAQGVPPYIICSDATLNSMCRIRPRTAQGMLTVSGMGEVKTARYGEAFLKEIRLWEAANQKTRQQVSALARQAQSVARRKQGVAAQSSAAPAPVRSASSAAPSATPSAVPSATQSAAPSAAQSAAPSATPSATPSAVPSAAPLEDDDEAIADAYLSGRTVRDIADALDVPPGKIRQRLWNMDLIF